MTFTVIWKPSAESKLAAIWNEATDRHAVTSAANAIDALLRAAPESSGESRDGMTRILIVAPLVVVYEVREDDRQVLVLSVR
jgi:plasmid stabilization system protein ParE